MPKTTAAGFGVFVASTVVSWAIAYGLDWLAPMLGDPNPAACTAVGVACGLCGFFAGRWAEAREAETAAAESAKAFDAALAERDAEVNRLKIALDTQRAISSIAAATGVGEDKLREIIREESPRISLATEDDIRAMFE